MINCQEGFILVNRISFFDNAEEEVIICMNRSYHEEPI